MQVERLKLTAQIRRTATLHSHPLLLQSDRDPAGLNSIPDNPLFQSTSDQSEDDQDPPRMTEHYPSSSISRGSFDTPGLVFSSGSSSSSLSSRSLTPLASTLSPRSLAPLTSSSLSSRSLAPLSSSSSCDQNDATIRRISSDLSNQSVGECDSNGSSGSVSESGGYSTATGLSLLVEKCLGKPLDKSEQLSDWERRPLKEKQIKYAGVYTYMYVLV